MYFINEFKLLRTYIIESSENNTKHRRERSHDFLLKVQYNSSFREKEIEDPGLQKKIRTFLSKTVSIERQKYIDALKEYGFEGDENLWNQYTLEQLKIEYKQITSK
jgi:hypothetical protein